MQQNHPDAEIKHISHILDEPDSMRVQWGNQADIPFNSFTVMKLNVGDEGVHCHVDVPFLITTDHIHHPIVGFNAIRHIAKESSDVNFLNRLFEKAFNNTNISKIEAFVNLIQSQEQQKVVVKIKGKDCITSPGRIVQVACKTNVGCLTSPQPMIFQQGEVELPEGLECMDSVIMLKPGAKNDFQIPISNTSNHDIILKKNTIIGRAEYINSIIPLPVKFNPNNSVSSIHAKEDDQPEHQHQSTIIRKEKTEAAPKVKTEHQLKVLESIDLGGLISKQKEMVRQVIKEECDMFSGNDDDIGDIRSHPMKISLKDDHPVQLNYNSVPRVEMS